MKLKRTSKKKTDYAIKYDYMESVLLSLGKDWDKAVNNLLLHETDPAEVGKPYILLVKRIERLEDIFESLSEIYNDVNNQTKKIINMLYIRCVGFEETSRILGIRERNLLFRHHLIVDEMMELQGLFKKGMKKARVKRRRTIPRPVKEKVFKRDKGKCTECGSKENLHYHHIKRYASGGKDTVENLILLCVNCHAEEHKNENSYHILKAMTER